ncbi:MULTISPECIES: hypothetical protein [unclassified Sphingobium]|uniref:hypothetical protein n=1 Tax=unclassified Sphingobium TaxID=2611147 RepID=UPI0022243055|nr:MULTISPECIES: hypothetical protein [unclassified Sphingobium]MCW2410913.1 hypothetical protein [Sphingobium sp. B8D3D]MCW2416796.1 hypothetical protein [Sphingobium sp. B8D3A]
MEDRNNRRAVDLLNSFPLLLIPVLIYNLVALFAGAPQPDQTEPALAAVMRGEAFTLPMLSGVVLMLSWGDMLLLLTIVFLLVEVVRSTRRGASSIANLLLTMAVFLLCAVEFLLLPRFVSATFFLLTMIVLLHGLTGLSLWLADRRHAAAAPPA